MKLHVIIPVYNVEKYLRQCVASVLNQPFQDLDIVLVDDGSPDRSGVICDELAARDSRISVIHQQNKGLPGARNSGIEYVLSHGAKDEDYIAFLDSDDAWVPNVVTDSLLETCAPYEIIVFPFYLANENLSHFRKQPLTQHGVYDSTVPLSVWSLPVVVWNRFYRTSFFRYNPIRFQASVRCHEDICFSNFFLYFARNFLFLDKYLVLYRNNPRSIMKTDAKKNIAPKMTLIDGLLDGIHQFQIDDASFRRRIYDYCCLCFLGLAETHYESLYLNNVPYRILEDHPVGQLLRNHDIRLSQRERDRINNMMHHRIRFKCKCFLRGIFFLVRRLLYKIPLLRKIYEYHQFPITEKEIAP